MDYKHIYLEEHAEGTLIKRVGTGDTIGGITLKGAVLLQKDAEFTDDEWLELMTLPPSTSTNN